MPHLYESEVMTVAEAEKIAAAREAAKPRRLRSLSLGAMRADEDGYPVCPIHLTDMNADVALVGGGSRNATEVFEWARMLAAAPKLYAMLERIDIQLGDRRDKVIVALLADARKALKEARP